MKIINIKTKLSKKTLIILVLAALIFIASFLLMLPDNQSKGDNFYYIGVATTFNHNSSDGINDMIQGIRLATDRVNQSGGINGKQIRLIVQNDKNDSSLAMKIASDFSKDNRILLVLGHYYSIPSLVGGDIYQKNAVPVITASATYDEITKENEWYFRTVPNNSYYADFLGTYLGLNLKQWPIIIISDSNNYHQSITRVFTKTIQKYDLEIIKQLTFNTSRSDVSPQLIKITNTIKMLNQKSVIFISANRPELVELVRLLKSSPQKYQFKIIGTDTAATTGFISELSNFQREQNDPGYYSNDTLVIVPSIPGIGNNKSFEFYKNFNETYNRIPSWAAACYYDTFMLSCHAIENAEIENEHGIRSIRRKIRNALIGFYDNKHAFKGLTGNIFFDEKGDSNRTLILGHYKNRVLIPEYVQYQRKHDQNLDSKAIKKALDNEIVVVDNTVLNEKKVVYTNIQVLSVEKFELKTHMASTVDFYLRFRFLGEFDDHNIRFDNTESHVSLGNPILETKENGVTERLYRINANFKYRSYFQSFPFDKHELTIKFHHNRITNDKLTFAPSITVKDIQLFDGWKIHSQNFSIEQVEDETIPKLSVIKHNLYYDQVNASVTLSRELNGVVFRYIFPFLTMFLLLYGIYFIPIQRFSVIICIISAVIVLNTFHYYKMLSFIILPSIVNAEKACFFIYSLSLLLFFSSISISVCHVKKQIDKEKMLRYFGIIGYPVIVITFVAISLWGIK